MVAEGHSYALPPNDRFWELTEMFQRCMNMQSFVRKAPRAYRVVSHVPFCGSCIGSSGAWSAWANGNSHIPPDSLEHLPYAAAGRGSRWTVYGSVANHRKQE